MGYSKVSQEGTPLIDLSGDTISAATLAYGATALDSFGNVIEGAAQKDMEDDIVQHTVNGIYYNPTVTIIGRNAFNGSKNLKKAVLPNVGVIGFRAFYGCTALEEIDAPNVVALVNEGDTVSAYSTNNGNAETFSGCTHLKRIYFPKIINCVGQYRIFENCSALEEVNMRNLLHSSQLYFTNCVSLKVLAFPKLQRSTSNNQSQSPICKGCTNLEAIDCGNVNQLDTTSFQNCAKLSTIILRGTTLTLLPNTSTFNNSSFASGGVGGTIYIPKVLYDALGTGTSDDYKAATNWSTVDSYGTITWAQIEGSIYETKSVDNLPINSDSPYSVPYPLFQGQIGRGAAYSWDGAIAGNKCYLQFWGTGNYYGFLNLHKGGCTHSGAVQYQNPIFTIPAGKTVVLMIKNIWNPFGISFEVWLHQANTYMGKIMTTTEAVYTSDITITYITTEDAPVSSIALHLGDNSPANAYTCLNMEVYLTVDGVEYV